MTDSKGTLAQILPTDVKNGGLDYSLNLGTDTEGGKLMLPALDGGARMYFSVKNRLKMQLAAIGQGSPYNNNTTPNGWSTGGDNFGTQFDLVGVRQPADGCDRRLQREPHASRHGRYPDVAHRIRSRYARRRKHHRL